MQNVRSISSILAALVLGSLLWHSAAAHPPDGVHHATTVDIEPSTITVRTDLFAGEIAFKDLIAELDTDGDGNITDVELQSWVATFWRPQIAYQIDTLTDAALTAPITASFTGPVDTLFYVDPLTIIATFPIPTDGLPHSLVVKDDYRWSQSDYQLTLLGGEGVDGSLTSNSGQVAVIDFETDPEAAGGNPTELDSSFATGSSNQSFVDKVKDAWLWILVGVIALGVIGWLIWERRKEAAMAATPAPRSKATSTPVKKKSSRKR